MAYIVTPSLGVTQSPVPSPQSPFPSVSFAVDISGVVKRYAGHVAVRDLSLRVPRGAVYGLLGPNGAGKTTTIRMILNIIAPDEGTIEVLGQPNATSGLLDRVGYLPEERGLYKKMQVRRLLRFLAALKGVSAKDADHRIDVWMERLRSRAPRRTGGRRRWTSCRAACSRRCSSSRPCCTSRSS